jgi:hypothetical protein
LDDILEALTTLAGPAGRNGDAEVPMSQGTPFAAGRDDADAPVSYHLEREGWATVLAPDRPVPPITVDMVNALIEEMRREREDRWLGLSEEDGE